MIDLHMHTQYSDGQYTVEEILKQCQEIGLDIISITDHDAVGAYFEMEKNQELKNIFKGSIIIGTELSFNKDNHLFDVLGYDIDYKKMQTLLDERYSEEKRKNMQRILLEEWKQICRNLGIEFDEDIQIINGTKSEAFNVLYTEISDFEKHPVNKKFLEYISRDKRGAFYKKHFSNPESQFFVNEARFSPTLKETVNMIHECGGKAFLAHSFAYGLENAIDFIEWAIEQGIDGIEKFYTSHTHEHERIIADITNRKKLYISGGSDFHGPKVKSEIQLGVGTGNLEIPRYIVEPWHPTKNILANDRKDECEEKVE